MPESIDSTSLLERAKGVTPGGLNSTARGRILEDSAGEPICIDVAEGAVLRTYGGSEYLDYLNGHGPIVLGHCDPDVNEAVSLAVNRRDLVGLSTTELEVEAAEKVVDCVPSADKVQFGTSGSVAVAHAIRAARSATGRRKILKFQGNYHGWYDPVALNHISSREDLGTNDFFTNGVLPEVGEETLVCQYNDLAGVEATVEENQGEVAAIILEPVAHDMGCIPPTDGFLAGLRQVADDHGIALIFDEIITGFRHGMGGVQERTGVLPDLTTMSKAVANGYPVSLVCGSDEFMREFETGTGDGSVKFAGTFNGHTASMAAVIETLHQLEERDVHERFDAVRERLCNALEDHIEDVGLEASVQRYGGVFATYFGHGPLENFEDLLEYDRETFEAYRWEMVDRGVLMVPHFPRANFLNASLTDRQVQKTIDAAGEALGAVASNRTA